MSSAGNLGGIFIFLDVIALIIIRISFFDCG